MTTPPVQPEPAPYGSETQPAPATAAYPAPAYQAQPVPQRPAQSTKLGETNAFALVSIILAFVQPIAGIVFGHIALGQIKRTGDTGRGLALTGLIVGYVYVAFLVLFVIFYVSMVAIMIGSLGTAFNRIPYPS